MHASFSVHPPARGESVEWRLKRVYLDGVRRVGSVILDEWERAQDVAQTALDEPGMASVILEGRPAGGEWRQDARYSLLEGGLEVEGRPTPGRSVLFDAASPFSVVPVASSLSIVEQRGYWVTSTGSVVSGWFSYSMANSSAVVRRKVGGRNRYHFANVDGGRFVLDSSAKPGVSTAWGWSS